MKTVFCTKHCLTGNCLITEHEVLADHKNDHRVVVRWKDGLNSQNVFHVGEFERTKEDATQRFNLMLERKIASLKKQIRKLEKLKDEGPCFQPLEKGIS